MTFVSLRQAVQRHYTGTCIYIYSTDLGLAGAKRKTYSRALALNAQVPISEA